MNWIDVVVLILWVVIALWGFSMGLIRVTISFVVVVVGLALSSRVAEDVGNIFSGLTDSEGTQTVAGFILIFVGVFIIGAIVSFWMGTLLRYLPVFGPFNRLGGFAVGIVVGLLLLSGVLTAAQKFTDTVDDDIDESVLAAFIADNFDVVIRGVKLVPGDWDDEVGKLR